MNRAPGRGSLSAAAAGAAVSVACVLPLFLTGALAVDLREDLSFGVTGLGLAVATYWATNAATSVHLGRVTDRIGAVWALRVAALLACVCALGIGLASSRWWHLVAWLAVGGAAYAIGQPASHRLMVYLVRPERLGMAFGVKAVAPPAASMLAGFSVPTIAVTLGWQWAFLIAAALAVVVLPAAGRRPSWRVRTRPVSGPPAGLANRATVIWSSAAFGLAVAGSTIVPVFFIDAVVRAGGSAETGGIMLAVASGCAVGTRLITGLVSDGLGGGHLQVCAVLLTIGAAGLLLLASGQPALMAAGVVVAMIGTWGFNAMFWFALVNSYRDVPGEVTGVIQPGAAIGGIGGPVLAGIVADAAGYAAVWAVAATLTVGAAMGMVLSSRRLY